jgi:nucleotide-binding universal stress UspA family protein
MKIRELNQMVIVPWDFSELSHRALLQAVQMVDDSKLVRVVHVSQVPTPYEVGIAWEAISEDSIRAQTEAAFQKVIAADPILNGICIDFRVLFGDPGRMICQFAEQQHANLIIVPSHGRSGFTRLLLGSVAERIVRHAHCPVLVLREAVPAVGHLPEPAKQKSVTVFC